MIEKYLTEYRHKFGCRGENGLIDCWGLTRLARHELYGKPLLPSFKDKTDINDGYIEHAPFMQRLKTRVDGAVIAVIKYGICVHVALAVGDNVLEIKRTGQRARLIMWKDFIKQYPAPIWEIRFYD